MPVFYGGSSNKFPPYGPTGAEPQGSYVFTNATAFHVNLAEQSTAPRADRNLPRNGSSFAHAYATKNTGDIVPCVLQQDLSDQKQLTSEIVCL